MKSIDQDKAERIRHNLDKPIVMIGLMGAGKTRIGRALADALELPFKDSDHEIEKAAGMAVSDIFEKFGETDFRQGEHRVINRLLSKKIRIIATGGGAVMTPATADLIWSKAISIWVRADMDIMVERVGRTDKRPLLKDKDPEGVLGELADKRYPVYEKADIVIDSHNGPVEAILNQTIDKLYDFLK